MAKEPADDLVLPLAAGVIGLLAYLATPSHYGNFDGVACAIAVELGNWRYLLDGNHLLYGALGRGLYDLFVAFGYRGGSLLLLNFLNALLGAGCLGVFLRLLLRLGAQRRAALYATAGLAVSHVFWFYSLEAHTYPLALLFLLVASTAALEPRPSPARVGLLHGLALAGHVTTVVLAPAVLHRLWTARPRQERLRSALTYAGAALGTGLAIYLAAGLLLRPSSVLEASRWLLGMAGSGPNHSFHWYGRIQPLFWFKGLLLALWAQPGSPGLGQAPGAWFLLQTAAAVGAVLWSARRSPEGPRWYFLLWLAGYWIFFSTWEPSNINYHLTDFGALWALIALARPSAGEEVGRRWLLGAGVGALALNNLFLGILPLTSPKVNPLIQEMAFVRQATPEGSWVATLAGSSMVYVPCFARRKPWTLPRHAGAPGPADAVYALPEVMDDPEWSRRLARDWDWRKIQEGPLRLYKLRRRL